MNTKFALALLLLSQATFAGEAVRADEKLYPLITGKGGGYINAQGEIVVKPQFDSTDFFRDDIAAVKLNDKWGFINKQGKILVQPQFDEYHFMDEGMIVVLLDKKIGLVSNQGKIVAKPQFDQLYSLCRFGLFAVQQNGKWGVINKNGIITAPITGDYDRIKCFREGQDFAESYKGNISGLINKEGKVVAVPQFRHIFPFNKLGTAAIEDDDGKIGFINGGKILIKPQFDMLSGVHNYGELTAVVKDKKIGLVGAKGELIAAPKFDAINGFHNGLAAAQLNGVKSDNGYLLEGGWGFINEKGEAVIGHQFEEVKDFKDGWAAVRKDGKWGYIDTQGAWVIPPRFSWAGYFTEDGLAVAAIDRNGWDLFGFINKSGEWFIKPQFRSLGNFKDGLAVADDPEYVGSGYINKTGEWVIQPTYGHAGKFDHGLARVQSRYSNVWKLIDEKGNIVASFDSIGEFNEYGTAYWRNGSGEDVDEGLIDAKGKIIAKGLAGMDIEGYKEQGLIRIQNWKSGQFGLMDMKGKILLKPEFRSIGYFGEDNLADVAKSVRGENDTWHFKWGVINTKGEFIVKPIADEPVRFYGNGLGVIIQDGKWGVVNIQGQVIVKPHFSRIYGISVEQGGLILALNSETSDPEWTYLDGNGNIVFYSETVDGKRVAKNAKGEIIWE
jgi:hypothetical protein